MRRRGASTHRLHEASVGRGGQLRIRRASIEPLRARHSAAPPNALQQEARPCCVPVCCIVPPPSAWLDRAARDDGRIRVLAKKPVGPETSDDDRHPDPRSQRLPRPAGGSQSDRQLRRPDRRPSGPASGSPEPTTDLHSGGTPDCIPAGGAAYLATHVRAAAGRPTRRTPSSSRPATSSARRRCCRPLFHDEPSIEAFNMMDLDYNGVGNHEFDEGITELLRMQYGNRARFRLRARPGPSGCHPERRLRRRGQLQGRRLPVPRRERHVQGRQH